MLFIYTSQSTNKHEAWDTFLRRRSTPTSLQIRGSRRFIQIWLLSTEWIPFRSRMDGNRAKISLKLRPVTISHSRTRAGLVIGILVTLSSFKSQMKIEECKNSLKMRFANLMNFCIVRVWDGAVLILSLSEVAARITTAIRRSACRCSSPLRATILSRCRRRLRDVGINGTGLSDDGISDFNPIFMMAFPFMIRSSLFCRQLNGSRRLRRL